jgi:hypothetical protein
MMYWNMKNTKYAVIIIASIMVIVGTTLTPVLQQQANAAVQVRSQHMNQENLCYRNNTCRQSDVGQNTLGNDNQVTGFADQSDNLQQSSTANKTTPTPTPTPTPTTAILTVIKIVAGNTTATPSQFTIHVTGNNPNPPNFGGSATGTDVTLGSGPFSVTETLPAGTSFTNTTAGDCAGTIAAGRHLSCTITNTFRTCVECFTSILSQTQINAVLAQFTESITNLTSLCDALSGITEIDFRNALSAAGVQEGSQNELIACLIGAGIVFT